MHGYGIKCISKSYKNNEDEIRHFAHRKGINVSKSQTTTTKSHNNAWESQEKDGNIESSLKWWRWWETENERDKVGSYTNKTSKFGQISGAKR